MSYVSQMLASDGFIITNKKLIRELGLHQAVLIGELCSQYNFWKSQNKLDDNDSFYCTQDKIEENTGLSARQQRSEFKKLQDAEIISIHRRGLPAVNFYQIHFDRLTEILEKEDTVKDAVLDSTKSNVQTLQNVTSDLTKCNLSNKEDNKKEKKDNSKELYNTQNCTQSFLGSNKKQKKKSLSTQWKEIIDDFTSNEELKKTIWEYISMYNTVMQDKGKVLYANVLKGKLNELLRLTSNINQQIKILQYSISNGFVTLYYIKEGNKSCVKSNPAKTDCGLAIKETNEDAERNNKLWKELEESGKSAVY